MTIRISPGFAIQRMVGGEWVTFDGYSTGEEAIEKLRHLVEFSREMKQRREEHLAD